MYLLIHRTVIPFYTLYDYKAYPNSLIVIDTGMISACTKDKRITRERRFGKPNFTVTLNQLNPQEKAEVAKRTNMLVPKNSRINIYKYYYYICIQTLFLFSGIHHLNQAMEQYSYNMNAKGADQLFDAIRLYEPYFQFA